MTGSETQSKLIAALMQARSQFPKITKRKQGQAGNRQFKYAPMDEVLDAINQPLQDAGLLVTQPIMGRELVTRLDHVSGEWRESRTPINEEHANMQSYGIELMYLRRYSIQAMLGIVTEDDEEADAGQQREGVDHVRVTGKDVLREHFEMLGPEVQQRLRGLAPKIAAAAMTSGQRAKEMIEEVVADYDRDSQVAVKMGVWYLLDSKTTSAIRKVA